MYKKKTILIALFLCLAGSMTSFADVIVYENNYNGETVGGGFDAWNWGDNGVVHNAVYADYEGNIVVEHTGTIDNSGGATAVNMRFGSKWGIELSGNTSTDPADYTIEFDIRNISGDWDPIGLEFFVLPGDQGYGSGISQYAQADGWVHVTANLADLSVGWWAGTAWDMTLSSWQIEVGGPAYPGVSVPAGTPAFDQIWLMDNLKITMLKDEVEKYATDPVPDDEETDVCRDVVLSWTPGIYAPETNGHQVFFSDDYNDVNEGVNGVIQDVNTYTLSDLLDWGTTYYWRVDEANSTAPTGWDQGDIWQFTVEPLAYVIENITATASSNVAGKDPANTLTLEGDLHSTNTSEMWLSDSELPGQAWIEYEFDKVYDRLYQMWVWNYNGEFPLTWYGINSVTIEYSLTGIDGDWKPLEGVPDFNQAPGLANYVYNTTVNFDDEAAAKYVRITANSNHSNGVFENYGLSEVRFFYIPVLAREPSPDDEAPDVAPDVILTWRAGREAAEHKVYFSSSEQAVTEGTITPESISGDGCEASYDPGYLDLSTTYYWKVNEISGDHTWQGDVWSFTTADYLVVDDMEFYGDSNVPGEEGSRIFYIWRDGFAVTNPYNIPGNGTASQVGHWPVPIMETGIIRGGSQSMPFYYFNDGTHYENPNVYYSQITAQVSDLPIGENWTRNSVKALKLYFYGDSGNDVGEPMWVKLTDQSNSSGRVTYGTYADEDVNNLAGHTWHQWSIELVDFGVDLEHVKEISIGIGEPDATSPGGTGLMYFDDIQLYKLSPEIPVVEPVSPGTDGLIAAYGLDGDVLDTSGNGNDGMITGNPGFVEGVVGQALDLPGDGASYVDLGDNPLFGMQETNQMTVAAWVTIRSIPAAWAPAVAKGEYAWRLSNVNEDLRYHFGITLWSNPSPSVDGVTVVGADEWHHVAGVYDGNKIMLYLDGVLDASVETSSPIGTNNFNVFIGLNPESTDRTWNGLIDELYIYNRALSEGEILYFAQ